jgi:hypothetical protein
MNRNAATLVIVLCGLAAGGCISLLGPEDVRFRVSLAQGVGLDRKFAIGADGLTVGMATALAGPDMKLKGISWVDVGIYHIRGDQHSFVAGVELPGWEPIVRVREGDSEAKIFVKQSSTSLKGLLVLARENDELVIARVRGRLDQLLDSVMEHGAFDFDFDDLMNSGGEPEVVCSPEEVSYNSI